MPSLVWDQALQPLMLGGALVLRMESEMLACHSGWNSRKPMPVFICGQSDPADRRNLLIAAVFSGSSWAFEVLNSLSLPARNVWPSEQMRAEEGFSYFQYKRVCDLYRSGGQRPRLSWNNKITEAAREVRMGFGKKLYTAHLRWNDPFTVEESNATPAAWETFLAETARPGEKEFLLLSDDPLPAGFRIPPGVFRAADLQMDLLTQLALIPVSDGYLGMASGLGASANFSEVPHVIFKHPSHHAWEMLRELGDADRYPFFHSQQALWRCEADADTLRSAWEFIQR
jgi:hypothetical protein